MQVTITASCTITLQPNETIEDLKAEEGLQAFNYLEAAGACGTDNFSLTVEEVKED